MKLELRSSMGLSHLKQFTSRYNCIGRLINLGSIRDSSSVKIPPESSWKHTNKGEVPKPTEITTELIDHLERLSLVDFNNQAGVERLGDAIKSANLLFSVDVDGVEPMDSVLEQRNLYLRKDEVTEGGCRKEILQNAARTDEDYFVSPPGNIPLKKRDRVYGMQS